MIVTSKIKIVSAKYIGNLRNYIGKQEKYGEF